MDPAPLLLLLSLAILASFAFWIFVAYGALRVFRVGMCSVCGAVVTVWSLNLAFSFMPGWVTLLLMGQSVVGGATLLRDLTFQSRHRSMDRQRFFALSQLVWFGFILAGTFVLGLAGLVLAWEPPVPPGEAARGLLVLEATLAGAFVASVVGSYATHRLLRLRFCAVCAAVTLVWAGNLALQLLPPWVTVFLLGQSAAGVAGLGRDFLSARFGIDALPQARKRPLKQIAYLSVLLTATLAAAGILVVAAAPLIPS